MHAEIEAIKLVRFVDDVSGEAKHYTPIEGAVPDACAYTHAYTI